MSARPNPAVDLAALLTAGGWPTLVFWALLVTSCVIAVVAWVRLPMQRSLANLGIWLLRLAIGGMWWQQSLWKIPPHYDGLLYWMRQQVDHAAIPLQGDLVGSVVVPNIGLFGPFVYAWEVAIGVSLMLGLFSRVGALMGLLMGLNLWLGLYSAPGEWPWTYGYLIVLQALFVIRPPGRELGVDALLAARRLGMAAPPVAAA